MNKDIIFKVHIPNGAGIGNTLKGFISGLTINENTKIECNISYILGNFDTILEDQYILKNEDYSKYQIEPFSSCRWLILKSEENLQEDLPYEYSDYNNIDLNNEKYKYLFTAKVTIDHHFKKELLCVQVINRFLNTIKKIKFKNIIYEEINKYNFNFNNTLGISVRTWKSIHENNIDRKYNFNEYENAITDILSKNININTIFISFDNDNVKNDYFRLFNKFNNLKIITYYNEKLNYIQNIIIKIFLLSKCGHFICNRISTYSELVFWFSELKQNVIPLF